MEFSVEKANKYLEENAGRIDKQYRPHFHLAPPVGWMNDPNGLCFYKGKTHIFYQYYPYDSCWGPMHWGHAYTYDNCVFHHCGVALAPDRPDETGCFSGGATVCRDDPDKLLIMYTKHYNSGDVRIERQGLAYSRNGLDFVKQDKPAIDISDLPDGFSSKNFRDPNPVLIGGEYFVFVGSEKDSVGAILVYSSDDGEKFRYRGSILSPYFGQMGECPDFFKLDGHDVLIASAIGLNKFDDKFKGSNSSLCFIGKFDSNNCDFRIDSVEEIDCGNDFYAPQTYTDAEGRRVMIAWMDMWGRDYFLHSAHHGYNGAMTYPRVLSVRGGKLYQAPAPGIEKYRRTADLSRLSKCMDLTFRIKEGGCVRIAQKCGGEDSFCLSMTGGRICSDASHLRNAPRSARVSKHVYDGWVEIRALCDVSSLEFFIDGGRETFTERYYIPGDTVTLSLNGAEIEELYELDLPEENFDIER